MTEPHAAVEALVHELPGIALSLEADGRIRYANAQARTMLGYELTRLVGEPLLDIVHPDDRPRLAGVIEGSSHEAAATRCRVRHADGTWRQLEMHVAAGERQPLVAFAVSREAPPFGQVPASGSPSRIAHDLNNHLSTILGFAELLLADLPEGDPYRDDLAEIHKAGKSALVITRRLSTLFEPRDAS